MSTAKNNNRKATRSSKTGKFVALTVGELQQKSGVKFNARSNTKVSTYLTTSGVPSFGKVLEKVERNLAK
jgi:hypothetical protein